MCERGRNGRPSPPELTEGGRSQFHRPSQNNLATSRERMRRGEEGPRTNGKDPGLRRKSLNSWDTARPLSPPTPPPPSLGKTNCRHWQETGGRLREMASGREVAADPTGSAPGSAQAMHPRLVKGVEAGSQPQANRPPGEGAPAGGGHTTAHEAAWPPERCTPQTGRPSRRGAWPAEGLVTFRSGLSDS